jgi:CheY-like chemotaxis protein
MFQKRHHNRRVFPKYKILVCEDDLLNQSLIAARFASILDNQGLVEVTFVPGAVDAASIISNNQDRTLCILLDHDMPYGNGSDLIEWMTANSINIPVITFSGIPENNEHMAKLLKKGEFRHWYFSKWDVIGGFADQIIFNMVTQRCREDMKNDPT